MIISEDELMYFLFTHGEITLIEYLEFLEK